MNTPLSQELIKMAKEDLDVRKELSDHGALYNKYHPRMKAIHDRNAKRLSSIVDEFGWPGKSLVGTEGASAAWLILQHAVAHPDLQRRCFPMLVKQVENGEISPVEMAMLEDRIRCFEGRPQRFGTQFDWDHNKLMSPLPLDDFDLVQERRKKLGMGTLEEETEIKRKEVQESNEQPPENYTAYLKEKENWLKANGWRK
jgi:hypothetical protein